MEGATDFELFTVINCKIQPSSILKLGSRNRALYPDLIII